MAYAENSFKEGWDIEAQQEHDYWDSFQKGIERITEESETFKFLHEEPDIYTQADLKEKY